MAGVMQVGSNGDGDVPAYYLELESGAGPSRQMQWDGNVTDGFDSDRQSFELDADLTDSNDTMMAVSSFTDNGSISTPPSGSGTIVKVQIAAQASAANVRLTWLGVRVTFSNANNDSAQVDLPTEATPVADTFDGQEQSSLQVVEVTPLRDDYTHVNIQAVVQLESSLTTQPATDAMVGKVLIFSTGS